MSFKECIGIIAVFGYKRVNDEWWIAGHTNKNWFGLKKDIERVLEGTAIPQPNDKVVDKKLVKVGETIWCK